MHDPVLFTRIKSRTFANVTTGCWLWQGSFRRGYGRLSVGNRSTSAHRAIFSAVHGPVPKGTFVCHECDNPACVNPAHLFLGTPRDNYEDMVSKGRRGKPRPSKPHRVKLSAEQIRSIRERFVKGVPGKCGTGNADELAAEFGVHRAQIHKVANGQCWGPT